MEIEFANSAWHSYPKVWAIGHPSIPNLFSGPVTVQEKVDGSQVSFGVVDGILRMRSRNAEFHPSDPPGLFGPVAATAMKLYNAGLLRDGIVYRGEAVSRPRHNALTYSRIPHGGVILFDCAASAHRYMPYDELAAEADRLGLEVVPLVFHGIVDSKEQVLDFVKRESVLGGAEVEGVVVKNYSYFLTDNHVGMGKYVRESYKEVQKVHWKSDNPTPADRVKAITEAFGNEHRWRKAVQHLRDAGQLLSDPKDIGALIKEVKADVRAECEADIKEALFRAFFPQIERGLTAGLPEWYKQELLAGSFNNSTESERGDNE